MNICTWNVRGINDPLKVVEVKKVLGENKIALVALIETRVKIHKSQKIQKKFGHDWEWTTNYSLSPRGRIWIGWKSHFLVVQVVQVTEQLIHCHVADKAGKFAFNFTAVYGLHMIDDRKPLWSDLVQVSRSINLPCLVMGDFNSILASQDRVNGAPVSDAEVVDFQNCVDHADLTHLPTVGNYYSWSNKGIGATRICSRIDWSFGNDSWVDTYGAAAVDYANSSISDHTPLIIRCGGLQNSGGRPSNFSTTLQIIPNLRSWLKRLGRFVRVIFI